MPDVRTRSFKDAFKISPEGTIEIGAGAPRVRGVEHPTEADVVLLVIVDRGDRTQAARREHGACHKFQGDPVFDKDF